MELVLTEAGWVFVGVLWALLGILGHLMFNWMYCGRLVLPKDYHQYRSFFWDALWGPATLGMALLIGLLRAMDSASG